MLRAGHPITIGTPVHGMSALVLDHRLRPVPPGVAGELYLAGGGLARGYRNRPGLTADRFLPNPWGAPGSRMYRTGDVVRWRVAEPARPAVESGTWELEYVGRSDFQVKIRGFRVELGEIDAVLGAHPDVDFATTMGRDHDTRGTMLVSYVLPKPGRALDPVDLTDFAARRLPSHMVPAALVVLDKIPLTPVGKVDRKALPEPVLAPARYRAPVGPAEVLVARTFAALLDAPRVGADDDFFALGGNSLIATRLAARLSRNTATAVPVRAVFDAPTVRALATRIALSDSGFGDSGPTAVTPRPEIVPLSIAQQRMWMLNRLDTRGGGYNIAFALRLTGDLNPVALRAALGDVIARHETLRTRYPESDGVATQVVVAAEAPALDVVEVDPTDIEALAAESTHHRFDVTTEVPVRIRLLRVRPAPDADPREQTHVLLFVVHHIAADGWSFAPLTRDLATAYQARSAGTAPGWQPLPLHYADYALWQRRTFGSVADPESESARQLEFWRAQLHGAPELSALPTDRPRPAIASQRGAARTAHLSSALQQRIHDLAATGRTTPFMVLHAALSVLLSRFGGSDDIVVGAPVAGRGHQALDDLVGMFVNTLVLRTPVHGGDRLTEHLDRVRAVDLAAFDHAAVPFEQLVDAVNPVRSQAHAPLYQVSLTLQNQTRAELRLEGLRIAAVDAAAAPIPVDQHWTAAECYTDDGTLAGIDLHVHYAADLFDPETIDALLDGFERILTALTADGDIRVADIELMAPAERDRLLADTTAYPVEPRTLPELSAGRPRRPAAPAVTFDGVSLSYREFDRRVQRLARYLIGRGVGPDTTVAVRIPRSLELVVAIHAVVAAGAAYVPLDPEHPVERVRYVLDIARPECVLTTSAVPVIDFPDGLPVIAVDGLDLSGFADGPLVDAERLCPLRSEHVAYVIFTSGSTGRPKGVAVSHGAIVNRLVWMQSEYCLGVDDVVLQKTPVTFDVSVWELFWPLQVGARLVVARPDGHRDPGYLSRLMVEESVTTAHFVPSMLAVYLSAVAEIPSSLRRVFTSGEALGAVTAARWRELGGGPLHNLYGPTEAAVDVTFHEVTAADSVTVPIGRPVFNTRVYVLDSLLRPVPIGVSGELYLAGGQLARGYLGRSDLTADRFVADPYHPGLRMYRTGDLVRWNRAGELEYLGRNDFQVKLRGLRIELGEIEAALTGREGVAQAAVVVAGTGENSRLHAYVVPAAATVDPAAVLTAAGRALPAYMVPSGVTVLAELPVNASGKLDRAALPAVDPGESSAYRAPAEGAEAVVAAVMAELLGCERIGADDDFFAAGGNSLSAMRVVARVNAALGCDLNVAEIFGAPTPALLARIADAAPGTTVAPLVAGPRPERIPLSPAQTRIWLLNRIDPGSARYNIPFALRLSGELDEVALAEAVTDVLTRHESLRTVFPEDARGPHQRIRAIGECAALTLRTVDATDTDLELAAAAARGFDLRHDIPLRVDAFRIAPTEHILLVVAHHIAADGVSTGPLARDLMTAYAARRAGAAPAWQPLPVQYADFALWQHEVLGRADDPESRLARQIDFWRDELADLPAVLDLPGDRPRPAVASGAGAAVEFRVPADLTAALEALARRTGVSLFMVVHAAYAAVLAKLSGTEDLAIGTPIAGRSAQALDDLVGMFVNTLALRTRVRARDRFGELLAQVREHDVRAFAHADLPFDRVVEELDPERSAAYAPIVQVLLSFEQRAETALRLPGLDVSDHPLANPGAQFDLALALSEIDGPDGRVLHAVLRYATDLFDEDTVHGFGRRLLRLLTAVTTDPDIRLGDIDLLEVSERLQVLDIWNATETEIDRTATLPGLFDAQAARSPHAPALTFEGTTVSYADFAAEVNRLARHLIACGVGPGSLVALHMRRSRELVVGMYAALAAGAAYVPLDPEHPVERVRYVLDIARPECVLTTSAVPVIDFPDGLPVIAVDGLDLSGFADGPLVDAERLCPLRSEHVAYVIFTSGSTGRPKGVAVSHGAIVNRLVWMQSEYCLGVDDVVLQKTPVTFDVSVWELFWPLQVGARLVVARPDGHRDPGYLSRLMVEESVTTAHFVPSMLAVYLSALLDRTAAAPTALRRVFTSGEALDVTTAARWRELCGAALHNLYGPTEAAVDVTFHEVTAADSVTVPIGRPVANTRVYVLDSCLRPVPVGVTGELYLAGAQLAEGYLARPDLTADRFVADPFHTGARMYRTGDIARWRATGELEYVGRSDFQVKVRGLRIELGEIENALREQDGIAAAVAVVRDDNGTGDRIVAYVVAESGRRVDSDRLRAECARRLPEYMVPALIVTLDALPLNTSGKLDRKALPEPVFLPLTYRAPTTRAEQAVAAAYTELLGLDRAGLDDDFFALGGNSLTATRVAARLGTEFDADLPVRLIFDAPTVAGFAARIAEFAGRGTGVPLVARPRPDLVPLSPAQQRMWFLNRLDPDQSVHNIPVALRLTGTLEFGALAAALADTVARHETLRTVYPDIGGIGYQQIQPADHVPVLSRLHGGDIATVVGEFVAAPFDVTTAVPLRVGVLATGAADEHILVLVVHHIAADGFSMAPLARDLAAAYAARSTGAAPALPALAVQYADYALWQREVLGDESDPESPAAAALRFWRDQLRGLPTRLELPTDRPRPAVAGHAAATATVDFDARLRARLEELAARYECTPFMVVHAALAVLLARMSGTGDIAVGAPVAGRGAAVLDELVGMFVNTLVLRTEVTGAQRFSQLLRQVRERDLAAFGHADIPFERLVEVLDPPRSQAHHPLFQVALFFQNLAPVALELGDLSVGEVLLDTAVNPFDLQVTVTEREIGFTYATDLFDPSTAEALATRFLAVLTAVAEDPERVVGDIDLFAPGECERVLTEWNASAHRGFGEELLLDEFEAQAAVAPQLVAVRYVPDDGSEPAVLTYGELDSRSNRLARHLIAAGVGPESLVALSIRRSPELVVAMYAVLKAGGAYVPIDPDHPAQRIAHILDTARPAVLLSATGATVPFDGPVVLVDTVALDAYADDPIAVNERHTPMYAAHPAYVIFTSGSTGKPKGVTVSHAAIVNQTTWMQAEYRFTAADVYLQKTATTFDVSLWGYFLPLRIGATLVLAGPDGHRDPGYLAEVIADNGVTVTDFVPSMLSVFAAQAQPAQVRSLTRVFVIGEALPAETVRAFGVISSARLHNLYGPTEAAVSITHRDVTGVVDRPALPIGSPEWNSRVYVLDSRLRPTPPGVAGELYLAGAQLARGYHGRADLTADRFVANPFTSGAPGDEHGSRMYRTGDLARWDTSGATPELVYLGRTDFQLKFRGQRIELGEIEAVLAAVPGIAAAAVRLVPGPGGDHLIGFVTVTATAPDLEARVRRAAAADLPGYMVPSAVVVLDAFPLNASGKLDRAALPDAADPRVAAVFGGGDFRAPATADERLVAEVFAQVLGIERAGADDDFFALGGNSLVATRVLARLGERHGRRIPVRTLFEHPTVAGLAVAMNGAGDGAGTELAGPVAGERPDTVALAPVQQGMWFLNRLDPDSAADNIAVAVRILGDLDAATMRGAFADVVARHEVLRTHYPLDAEGSPSQVVLTPERAGVEFAELTDSASIAEFAGRGFDVTVAPPVRALLIRESETSHVFVVVVHHISADGYSLNPLVRDLIAAYLARRAGTAPDWPDLSVQYADYALWQRESLDAVETEQLDFWTRTLAELPTELALPTDRPRPPLASRQGAVERGRIDGAVAAAVQRIATAHGATPFMVWHAALTVLLGRLSGADDIAVGTPVAGRGASALDDLVGMFVNTLTLRTRPHPEQSFSALLDHTREVDLAALAHAALPFDRVVDALGVTRTAARNPLFTVSLSYLNLGARTHAVPGLILEPVEFDRPVAKFDLQFTVSDVLDADGHLPLELTYATDLFDPATAAGLLRRLGRVIGAVVAEPQRPIGEIELLSPAERTALLGIRPRLRTEPGTLATFLTETVRHNPTGIALSDGGHELTYAELDAESTRLARVLIESGVGAEDFVAIAITRSLRWIVAWWAVAKSGAAFLPVDPDYPADRIAHMLADSGAAVGITTVDDSDALPATARRLVLDDPETAARLRAVSADPIAEHELVRPVRPEHPVWMIYTSGTTGTPKGVVVSHAGVGAIVAAHRRHYRVDPDARVLHASSPSFDASMLELLMAFAGAATAVIAPVGVYGGAELTELLRAQRISHAFITPSVLRTLDPAVLPRLRRLTVGGESYASDLVERWAGDREFHNTYGPTETTVFATVSAVKRPGDPLDMGAPIDGMSAVVLDERLRPVPVGVTGELYLRGPGLARGYHARPALTAHRFVADPYGPAGQRLYRTGDLVRWLRRDDEYVIEYVGRSDHQVKVRGLRIELGEIDAVLGAHESVGFAATIGHRDASGETALVSYVVAAPGHTVDVEALVDHAARSLTAYMIPAAVMVIDHIPLTPTGKLDRKALPEPVFRIAEFRAPRTAVEATVAEIVAGVLGLAESRRVGVDDDFFALGGNSLTATRLAARLGAAFDRAVPVRTIFEHPTVAALAAAIAAADGAPARPALTPRSMDGPAPLSPAQQRMWLLNRMDEQSAAYTIPLAMRLSGDLDSAALSAAVADVVARHEVLRTVYPQTDAGPVQVVLPVADAPVPRLDPVPLPGHAVVAAVSEFVTTAFDVTTAVPLRARLFALTDTPGTEHVLVVAVHHIAADGSSLVPLARDVMTAYAARRAGSAPGWAPLPVQYADFALWQREVLGAEDDPASTAARQLGYWTETLAQLPDQLALPTDRPRPATVSTAGDSVDFTVDAALHARLVEIGRGRGATLFMVVHAAYAALLARLSATTDIAVGTPIAGRGDKALDDLVGMFVNTLVLRTRVDPATGFADLLTAVRDGDLAAFSHADIPFERLVEVLNPVRSTARHPLFQVGFSFHNQAAAEFALDGLTVGAADFDTAVSQFDLHLVVTDRYDESGAPLGMAASITYATALFDAATVDGFAARLVRLLEAVCADPSTAIGAIDLLAPHERVRMLETWNDTGDATIAATTLPELWNTTVRVRGAAPALIIDGDGSTRVTYAELAAEVNRLARHLISLGVGPETRVALALRRSRELIVAMYAVSVAGGAYVPVDPDQPAERVDYILRTAEPLCVLTAGSAAESVRGTGFPIVDLGAVDPAGLSAEPVDDRDRRAPLRPQHPAYVIFTSGSTGRPKGVTVGHGAVTNQLLWKKAEFGLGADDAVLLKTAATFDLSVWEFWSAAVAGGRLVVAGPDAHRDPVQLHQLMAREHVTTLHAVPSMLDALLTVADGRLPESLRRVLAIGEALPAATAQRMRRGSTAALYNLYGPTEAAVSITAHAVGDADTAVVPIGRPEANSAVYVLDSRLQPVPVGVPGELYLAGAQLARGYHGRSELTAERFVADPFAPGTRMYRTGDVVCWTAAGELEYRGRTDFQVKVRGFRIELGEIEAALRALPALAQVAVLAVADPRTADRLVAYLVPAAAEVDVAEVRTALARTLPSYMVPEAFVVLDALPLTVNGKLDRAALPRPEFAAAAYRAPATPAEQAIARIYAEVLDAPRVGADDDFFALGGNSLLATQVAARLGAASDTRIPVRLLFEASTVAALAVRLNSHIGAGDRVALTAGVRPEALPLSLAQQRMWFLNQFEPESAAYNIPAAVRLYGDLRVSALREAMVDVLGRHEVLRTVYPQTTDGVVQRIVPVSQVAVDLPPQPIDAGEVPARIAELAAAGFDVTTEAPIRTALLRISETDHVLVFVVHHIAADGWSMRPLTRDVMLAYAARSAGAAPRWSPLPVQYADYALWQRQVLGSEDDEQSLISTQARYWRDRLAGLPDEVNLPADRPRPAVQSARGGRVVFPLSRQLRTELTALGRDHNATLFMVVHAAWALFVARMSGTDDIAVGTPVAGRGEAELDDVVGMFVNTLVLRTRVDGRAGFTELLAAARETDLQAFGHADLPFERLVELVNPERSTARHPLFQVMLTFQNLPQRGFELPGLRAEAVDFDFDAEQFDLSLTVQETEEGLLADLSYARDLFDHATVETFARRFIGLLEAVVATPELAVGALPLLSDVEYERFTTMDGGPVIDDGLLPEIFARGLRFGADRVAVRIADREVTYGELDRQSSRLARVLIDAGVGPERSVAIALPRSYEMIAAVWAVAKAGGAYVPVDPSYPPDRVRHMVTDSGAVIGVTTTEFAATLPADTEWLALDAPAVARACAERPADPVTDAERLRPLRPGHAAYTIYTSGSTGLPKGVTVTHRRVANLATHATRLCRVEPRHRFLHVCSPSFDQSLEEWLITFGSGATLVIAPPSVLGGQELADLLRAERVTHTMITPAMLATVDPAGLPDLEVVGAGGDATTPELLAKWQPGRRFVNSYGPTEATISSAYAILVAGVPITIGTPVPGSTTLVLDARMQPVAPGVAGELYVVGEALARGYHGRPGLSAERFVACPWGTPGTRMYRTGDLVRWIVGGTGDWELEYLGRTDFQVKVRGFRIELGEIDSVLTGHDEIDFAVTLGRETPAGATALVSYVRGVPGSSVDPRELTVYAARSLPSHMVPAAIVVLDEVPLTPVGKLDRKALPEPRFQARPYTEPATPQQRLVATVLAEALGAPRVGADDDFFELGGNSLIATQVVARLGAQLGTRIPVRVVFDAPTVRALADTLADHTGGGRPELITRARPRRLPLSFAQQRMWLLNRMDPESAAYNVPFVVRLDGAVDAAALRRALSDVIDRHEVLRTIYPESEQGPVQRILPTAEPEFDIRAVTEARVESTVARILSRPFDVTGEIPVRAALLRVSDAAEPAHIVVLSMHHICADGASTAPLTRDLLVAYAARTAGTVPRWAPLPVQYADYTLWQRELLGAEDDPRSLVSGQLGHWRTALAGMPEQLELPTDRPRPMVRSHRGRAVAFEISARRHERLHRLARDRHASLFMVVRAALSILLARLSGTDDVAVGAPIAGRGEAELDDLIGMFVNTLVLRARVAPRDSFADLLDQVRAGDLAAYANSDVPFERLVELLDPIRSTARHPLFQVGLSFQNLARTPVRLPGVAATELEVDTRTTQFDLHWYLTDTYDEAGAPAGISAAVTYATDLFDSTSVQRFIERFLRIVDAVCADDTTAIGDIDVLDADERHRLLSEYNATARELALPSGDGDHPHTLTALFAAAVAAHPEAVALAEDRSGAAMAASTLTYADFDARTNRLARYLIARGIGPDQRVAVALPRSADLLIAIYAVIKAGAAYVPIDPEQPRERIRHILDTAQPECVLAHAESLVDDRAIAIDRLDPTEFRDDPVTDADRRIPLRPDHIAYVIFTSGSTGRPKGVAVAHRAIVNRLAWMQAEYGLTAGDVVLQKTPVTFDVSVWELFWPLQVGARLVLAAPQGHRDPHYLARVVAAESVTTLHFVPAMLAAFLAEADMRDCVSLRRVFASGEALPSTVAQQVRARTGARLYNLYGPTEAAVDVTHHEVRDTDTVTVPIGRPVSNTRVYVLDSRLRPVPAGVVGELYLSGTQLARGYLGRPDLTADRFVADPFGTGGRMYRTGDLVVWNADGELEYRGRSDFQVKLRGLRIEPGEIEAALSDRPEVAHAVAVVRGTNAVEQRLVAYVVAAGEQVVDGDRLRADLSRRLPAYMVPATVVVLDELPVGASGKLDRRALPAPPHRTREFRAPRTESETVVCRVFAQVLELERIGLDDNFFELGGTSLLAATLATRLSTALGRRVPVPALFTASTPAALADELAAGPGIDPESAFDILLPLRREGVGEPLFCVHPVGGIAWSFAGLAASVDRPLYGLQSPALREQELPGDIEQWARRYVDAIRSVQPDGPYHLLGWSLGGVLAHAVAVRLQDEGDEVALLAVMDSRLGEVDDSEPVALPELVGGLLGEDAAEFGDLDAADVTTLVGRLPEPFAALGPDRITAILDAALRSVELATRYRPARYRGDLTYFVAARDESSEPAAETWSAAVTGSIRLHRLPATHWRMTSAAALRRIGAVLTDIGNRSPTPEPGETS